MKFNLLSQSEPAPTSNVFLKDDIKEISKSAPDFKLTKKKANLPEKNTPLSVGQFRSQLLKKYHPDIVNHFLKHLFQQKIREIFPEEASKIEQFCDFFDMEKRILPNYKNFDSLVFKRIFNKYHKFARDEVTQLLNSMNANTFLTHENVCLAESNFESFYKMIPKLVKRYGESICQRALNHFSIMPTEILLGQSAMTSFEELCEKIDVVFLKEQQVAMLLETMPYKKIREKYEVLHNTIINLKDDYGRYDLEKELIQKAGKIELMPALINKQLIKEQADLFQVSREGTDWAQAQKELKPLDSKIHNNINDVFFLKSATKPQKKTVAVFKKEPNGDTESGAMEALAYDVCSLFNISSGVVPTKQKKLLGMDGSIQIFQDGLSYDELTRLDRFSQQRVINKISMRSFLEALLPILVLGNRDVHSGNFFIVKKSPCEDIELKKMKKVFRKGLTKRILEHQKIVFPFNYTTKEKNRFKKNWYQEQKIIQRAEDRYRIVVFDNGFSFQYSNYILTSVYKQKVNETKLLDKEPQGDLRLKQIKQILKKPLMNKLLKRKKNHECKQFARVRKEKKIRNKALNSLAVVQKKPGLIHNLLGKKQLLNAQQIYNKDSFSNRKLKQKEIYVRESLLPIRCAIFSLPHADAVIEGKDLDWLKKLTLTWKKSLDDFLFYLNSPAGLSKTKKLHHKSLDSYQLQAFNERLQKIIDIVHGKKPFTARSMVSQIYPFYSHFLTLTKLLYPEEYADLYLGAKTAEYLCEKAVKKGKLTPQSATNFLNSIYERSYF